MFNTKKFCKLHYDQPKFTQFDSSFYLGFLSLNIDESRDNRGRGRPTQFLSIPFPPAWQTFSHQPSDYFRELTIAHGRYPNSNQVFEGKSLTVKLRTPELQRVVIENINKLLQNEYLWYCQETLTCFKQKLRKFSDISTYK